MVLKKKEPITEAFDALKRIDELEKENKKLKKQVKDLKFRLLSSDEQNWARIAYDVFKWKDWEFINSFDSFKSSYIEEKERQDLIDLPFM